ncbi:MAG: tyrosine-type recombinase/integrase, partial [Oscillospiraceae bacterium]|nr:tyrosine-type recombinase/integrase [Oscillospiraceae bacterium]
RGTCKGVFFLIQNLHYLETGHFILTKKELKEAALAEDRRVLELAELPDGFDFDGALNKVIKRIIRDCNDAEFLKSENPDVLLPNFSCHSLRHTFTTRMCEAGTNIKLMQDILGHQDISTTMNIYADVTKELREKELGNLEEYFSNKATSNR